MALTRLRGITHLLIITAPTKADFERTGIIASAKLFFGPGEEDFLGNFDYIQGPGNQKVWRLPATTYPKDGNPVTVPVFHGQLAKEVSVLLGEAVERVRGESGSMKFGKVYLVPGGAGTKVEDMTPAKAAA